MSEPRLVLSTWRKMSLVGGVLSILLGLVLLFWPGKTLLVLTALVGVWMVVFGISRLADAFTGRTAGGASRGFSALTGAVYLVTGVIVLANLDTTLRFVAVLLGIMWILSGVGEVIGGITRVTGAGARTAAIVIGLINIVLGVLALFWPDITLLVLVWIAGIWLILIGIVQLYFAYRASKAEKELDNPAFHVVEER